MSRGQSGALLVAVLYMGCNERTGSSTADSDAKAAQPAAVVVPESKAATAPSQVTISGPAARALSVAVHDFSETVMSEYRSSDPVGAFLGRIENYEVVISDRVEPSGQVITVLPKPFPGGGLKGGGAEYVISREDFAIRHREVFE